MYSAAATTAVAASMSAVIESHHSSFGVCVSDISRKVPKVFLIIIMSRHQHGYPWLFLATLLHCLQSYILYWHRAVVCRSTSLISSSLLLQKCSACLVHLNWTFFVMGSKWPYSRWFLGCYLQDLFNIVCSILL